MIKDERITQKELSKRLGLNKNKLSNFMAYSEFPSEFITSILSLNNISSRTAGYLRTLFNKGDKYLLNYHTYNEDTLEEDSFTTIVNGIEELNKQMEKFNDEWLLDLYLYKTNQKNSNLW